MGLSEENYPKWQSKLHEIIFEADTKTGKYFDLLLIISILASVLIVMLDSVQSVNENFGTTLYLLEWIFTILFTFEYFLRIISVGKPLKYMFSFYGIIDLLAILPTYFSLLFPGSQYFLIIRLLRVLRIFRILKLVKYIGEARRLKDAFRASRRKITVFFAAVITLVAILGSLMYLIEGAENGFSNIPKSIYWAIVTLTTVGYGDISPQTALGQSLASLIMILGYSIIAVPTGLVTAELTKASHKISTQACPQCSEEGHDYDARFCKYCGSKL